MKTTFCMFIALGLLQAVCAEMRMWTDSGGRRIEAELVKSTDDTVTLRRANGTEGVLRKSDLSDEDQAYLAEQKSLAEQQEQAQKAEQEKKRNTVSISRRKIMLNHDQYLIKGVCYNPVPRGSDHRSFDRIEEDLALMVEAGINTIRVYSPIDNRTVLDKIYAAGLKIITGFGYDQNGRYDIRSGSFIDYINTYKDHGAILFWELGNEYNFHPEWFGGDIQVWYKALNQAAGKIHHIDPAHPVSTAHGELPDKGVLSSCPNIDIWGMNVYRWDSPASLFTEWKAISSKPMYLSEAGADRYMAASLGGYQRGENEGAQADATKRILEDVFSAKRVCSGVTLFAFVDELWKAGNNNVQDSTGTAPNSGGFPYDGAANEEFWGIVDIDRNTKEAYDIVRRKYNALR